jgi:hypothetical protein
VGRASCPPSPEPESNKRQSKGKTVAGKSIGSLILFMVVGGLVGSVLGEILGRLAGQGFWNNILTTGVHFGVQDPVHQPIAVNLGIVILSFGLAIKVSLLGILGLVVGVVLHWKL